MKRLAKPRGFTFNDLKNVVDGPGRRGVPLTPDQVGRGDRMITAEEERALMRISASVMEDSLDDKITTRDQFAAELGKLMGRALLLDPALLLAELDAHASTIRDAIKYEEWCASDPEGNPRNPGAW